MIDEKKLIEDLKKELDRTNVSLENKWNLAISRAIKIVKDQPEADKYRWHDLAKDPADLPVIDYEYLEVLIEDNVVPIACQYSEESGGFGYWHDYYDPGTLGFLDSEFELMDLGGVRFWRYIELPEGMEE